MEATSSTAASDTADKEDRDQEDVGSLLSTAAAFHRWQQAKLKATFRRQLEEILEDVSVEEDNSKRLKHQLRDARDREGQLQHALAEAHAGKNAAQFEVQELYASLQHMQQEVEAAEVLAAQHAAAADAAQAALAAEGRRREEAVRQLQQQLEMLCEDHEASLAQQRPLLDALAQRDVKVAELAKELTALRKEAAQLRGEASRMEGVVRATGERAASAEDTARGQMDVVAELRAELAQLRQRSQAELSELRTLRTAAAEASTLREQLAEANAAGASLAASRTELKLALDSATAQLAGAEERLVRLQGREGLREMLLKAAAGESSSTDPNAPNALEQLAAALEAHTGEGTELSAQLASAQAVVAQQEGHLRRLATQAADQEQRAESALERAEIAQLLNVQLRAELRRLAGAAEVAGSAQGAPTATMRPQLALLHSQLLEALTALQQHARGVDRPHLPLAPLAAQSRAASAALADAIVLLERVGGRLLDHATAAGAGAGSEAARGVERHVGMGLDPARLVEELGTAADGLQERLADVQRAVGQLAGSQGELTVLQGAFAPLAPALADARAAVERASEQLAMAAASEGAHAATSGEEGTWCTQDTASAQQQGGGSAKVITSSAQGLSSGERLRHVMRGGLRGIQTAQAALGEAVRAVQALGSPLVAGDAGYVGADSAVREALSALGELGELLSEPVVEVGTLRDRLAVAEARLQEKEKSVRSFRAALSSSLTHVGAIMGHLQASKTDMRSAHTLLLQLQQLMAQLPQDALLPGLVAGQEAAVLELEVAALQQQLERREGQVADLMARERRLLSGTGGDLVPADLLAAARNALSECEQRRQQLKQDLAQRSERWAWAREAFVERVRSRQLVSAAAAALAMWRLNTLKPKAELLQQQLTAAHAQLDQQHAASVHRTQALKLYTKRQRTRWRTAQLHAALLAWRCRTARQVDVQWRWRHLAQHLLQARRSEQRNAAVAGRAPSFVQKLLQRRRQPNGSVAGWLDEQRVLGVVLRAWHMVAHVGAQEAALEQAQQQVEAVSASLPSWVQHLGNRRRLERAWLGWRLAAVDARAHCSHAGLQQEGQVPTGSPARQRQQQQQQQQHMERWSSRQQAQQPQAWRQQQQQQEQPPQEQQQQLQQSARLFAGQVPMVQLPVSPGAGAASPGAQSRTMLPQGPALPSADLSPLHSAMAAVWRATGSPALSPGTTSHQPGAPQPSPRVGSVLAHSTPWRPTSVSPGISPIQSPNQPSPSQLVSAAKRSLAAALNSAPRQQQQQQQQQHGTMQPQKLRLRPAAASGPARRRSATAATAPSPERLAQLAAPKARPGAGTTAAARPRVQAAFGRTVPSGAWVPVTQHPAATSPVPAAAFGSPPRATGAAATGVGSPHAPWQSPVHADLAQLTGSLRAMQAELAARSLGVFTAGADATQPHSPHSPMRQSMQPEAALPLLGQSSPTRHGASAGGASYQSSAPGLGVQRLPPGSNVQGSGLASAGSPQTFISPGHAPAIILDARPPTAPLQQPSSPTRLPQSPLRPSAGLATTGGSSGQWHVSGQPRSTALTGPPDSASERLAGHETTSFSFKRSQLSSSEQLQPSAWGAPSTALTFQDTVLEQEPLLPPSRQIAAPQQAPPPPHSRPPAAPAAGLFQALSLGSAAQAATADGAAAAAAAAVQRPASSSSPLPDPRALLGVVPRPHPGAGPAPGSQPPATAAAASLPKAPAVGSSAAASAPVSATPGVVRFGLLPRRSAQAAVQEPVGMAGTGGAAADSQVAEQLAPNQAVVGAHTSPLV